MDTAALAAFNMVDEVMCATLHSHTRVKKGELVAATRAIPLVMKRAPVERAAAIAAQHGGVVSVKALKKARVGLVVTGSEVFHGLIEDKFAPILSGKVTDLGSEVAGVAFAPDDEILITAAIRSHIDSGCDLLLLSGGMSVDPDDVTRKAICMAGAQEVHYGAAATSGGYVSGGRHRRHPPAGGAGLRASPPDHGPGSGAPEDSGRRKDNQKGAGLHRPRGPLQGLS